MYTSILGWTFLNAAPEPGNVELGFVPTPTVILVPTCLQGLVLVGDRLSGTTAVETRLAGRVGVANRLSGTVSVC